MHLFHKWSKWVTVRTERVSYPWTGEDNFAYEQKIQERVCSVCGKIQIRTVTPK